MIFKKLSKNNQLQVKMRTIQLILVCQTALLALLLCAQPDGAVEAVGFGTRVASNVRNYLVNMVKVQVINKSRVMSEFKAVMSVIRSRFEAEKGTIDPANKSELDALYYKIVVEEVRALRGRVEGSAVAEGVNDLEVAELTKQFNENKEKLAHYPKEKINKEEELEEELELTNQLEDLEATARYEAEMGFSLSAESREALKARTKQVLGDLMQNELRQLALAILTSYLSNSPFAPIAVTLISSIRFKLVEFLMNSIMDVLATLMGKPVEIKPAPAAA